MTSEEPPIRSALITGGSGFVGAEITRVLRGRGLRVSTFDTRYGDEDPLHRRGSVLEQSDVDKAVVGMDVVFHLAGVLGTSELVERSVDAIRVNVIGTVQVLEACRRSSVSRVFYPTKPNNWNNTYSITKRAAEDFCRMYGKLHGLDVRILRWLNIYGPGQRMQPVRKAVPVMILQALHGRPVDVFGSGEQLVHLSYIDDVVRDTVEYVLRDGRDLRTRDTGNTVAMTVLELANRIIQAVGSDSTVRHLEMRPEEDEREPIRPLDTETAADLTGACGMTTAVEEGLTRTIAHYRDMPVDLRRRALDRYVQVR